MTTATHLLVIDDEQSIRWVLEKTLSRMGYILHLADSAEQGWELLQQHPIEIALIDLNLPGEDGLSSMKKFLKKDPNLLIFIMTGQSTMRNTVEAMKNGAFDYITKPFDIDEIEELVEEASKRLVSRHQIAPSTPSLTQKGPSDLLVGQSKSMRNIFKAIGRVASKDVSVLILGESGTGKELIARSIHQHSLHHDGPFVAINCAAIPTDLLESELFGHEKGSYTGATEQKKGKLEQANLGTLFLDEIGDMPLLLQSKLLRVLQEKAFERVGGSKLISSDMRVIAATHRNLEEMVAKAQFREDLFYRLNVFPIHVQPLRQRKEDIPLLVAHFLKKGEKELAVCKKNISIEALEALTHYPWPGNIRELENVIKSLMITNVTDLITLEALPHNLLDQSPTLIDNTSLEEIIAQRLRPIVNDYVLQEGESLMALVLDQVERPLLQILLENTRWNQQRAAKILGINRNTLRKKIEMLNILKDTSASEMP
ncbi:sigma-54 dependent transcriptional regulator [Deltaproteobacteria bacterium TL4]